jgi:hypothetical protein
MDATVFLILFVIAFGLIAWYHIAKDTRNRAQNRADSVIAYVAIPGGGSLRLTATELIEGYGENARRHPIAGLVARVEDSGTLNRRVTATRLVAFGVFALAAPKKQDDRELYLTIEGPTTAILRTIQVKNAASITTRARSFAMQVNMASKAALPA